jgi:hypothetical protein
MKATVEHTSYRKGGEARSTGMMLNWKDAELLVYLIDEEMDIYIGVQRLAT